MRPTAAVWEATKDRDDGQCVATGRRDMLSHQHRRAVGMGGTKQRPSITDSLTLTQEINDRCERDLQTMALAYGWKVKRWVRDPSMVPVFYPRRHRWARLTVGGDALAINEAEAAQMMRDVYGEEWESWLRQAEAMPLPGVR